MTIFYTVKTPVPEKQLMLDVIYLGTIPAKAEAGITRSLKWLTEYTGLNFKVRNWCRQKAPLKLWPVGNGVYFDCNGIDWAGLGIREAPPITLCMWKDDRGRSQTDAGHVSPFYTVKPINIFKSNVDYFNGAYYAWASTTDYTICHEMLHALDFWHMALGGASLHSDTAIDGGITPQNHLDYCANIKNSPAIRATLEKLTAPHGYGG
jgi:hypothetical protein